MATFTVTNLSDSGAGSLRDAILQANLTKGLDEITFDSLLTGGTINLTSGQLQITNALNINGLGANQLTIDGGESSRIFDINAEYNQRFDPNQVFDVSIKGLKITRGRDELGSVGGIYNRFGNLNLTDTIIDNNGAYSYGGIYNYLGNLNLINSTVSNNISYYSGGIFNYLGVINITNSNIFGNTGILDAGGIYNLGDLNSSYQTVVNITNSKISGNTAGSGGGIFNSGGARLNITSSNISGNTAGYGGGIINFGDAQLNIASSNISGNTARYNGGGILNLNSGPDDNDYDTLLFLNDSQISGNSATYGGGIYNDKGIWKTNNSTISGNSATYGADIYDPDSTPIPEGDTTLGGVLALGILGMMYFRQIRRKKGVKSLK
jgi:hypothetical protein